MVQNALNNVGLRIFASSLQTSAQVVQRPITNFALQINLNFSLPRLQTFRFVFLTGNFTSPQETNAWKLDRVVCSCRFDIAAGIVKVPSPLLNQLFRALDISPPFALSAAKQAPAMEGGAWSLLDKADAGSTYPVSYANLS